MERRGDIRAGTVQKGEKTFLAHYYDRSREWRESQLPEVSPRKHSAIYITSDICRPNYTHHREVNATNIPLCVPHCLPGTGLRWPLPFSLPFSFFLPIFLSFFLFFSPPPLQQSCSQASRHARRPFCTFFEPRQSYIFFALSKLPALFTLVNDPNATNETMFEILERHQIHQMVYCSNDSSNHRYSLYIYIYSF